VAAPKAFIGLFKDNAVGVVDTVTNREIGTIPVPAGPHGLVLTPDGKELFVSSDGASTVSIIDAVTDEVKQTIDVGQAPHGLAMTHDGQQVLAAVFGPSQVAFIDTATYQVIAQIRVPQPHNIAISPDGTLAYVASQASDTPSLAILDVLNRTQIGSIPLAKPP